MITTIAEIFPLNILRRLTIPFLLVALVFPVHAETNMSREEAVLQFERDWVAAGMNNDIQWMRRMLTDDFAEIDLTGKLNSKSDHIAQFMSGQFKLQSLVLSDLLVRIYGDVAVVTGTAHNKGTKDGRDISGIYSFTDVLLFRGGTWKVVSTQATKYTP
jgi:ketosteroid isomerase-like protein